MRTGGSFRCQYGDGQPLRVMANPTRYIHHQHNEQMDVNVVIRMRPEKPSQNTLGSVPPDAHYQNGQHTATPRKRETSHQHQISCRLCKQLIPTELIHQHYLQHRIDNTVTSTVEPQPRSSRFSTAKNHAGRLKVRMEGQVKGFDSIYNSLKKTDIRLLGNNCQQPGLKTTDCMLDQLINDIKLQTIRLVMSPKSHVEDSQTRFVGNQQEARTETKKSVVQISSRNQTLLYNLERSTSRRRVDSVDIVSNQISPRNLLCSSANRPKKLSLCKDIRNHLETKQLLANGKLVKEYRLQRQSVPKKPTDPIRPRMPLNILAQQSPLTRNFQSNKCDYYF